MAAAACGTYTLGMKSDKDLSSIARTRLLLACGVVCGPLFVLAFLIEGATRTDYDALRHPISSLAIGDFGWMQRANFIITGLLLLAFSVGLRRVLRHSIGAVWGPLSVGFAGIGLIGAGFFISDPVYGYPTDAPLLLVQYSIHGHLHDLFSILVFIGLPVACFVLARRYAAAGERGWAVYSVLTGVAMLVTFVLAGLGFKQIARLVDFAGVLQRLSLIIGWAWVTLLAVHLLRASARSRTMGTPPIGGHPSLP